jgi:hypothetical protein
VGSVTSNPTKLVLHFSEFSSIFYAIYKNQQRHFTIEVSDFYQGPWTLRIGPQKNLNPCNWVLGLGSGGPVEIPARVRRIPAGG